MSTPVNLDTAAIKALVAEVIRRIQAGQAERPAAGRGASQAGGQPGPMTSLPDRVITQAVIERQPAGPRRIVIDSAAVVTPSAVDRARELGLTLVRGAGGAAAAAFCPFMIAQAACRGDASARAAAIARAIPGGQQLPATGVADVIAALAGHASRDAARGVLLTGKPAMAVVLANRSASLRAVTARDAATLASAAADAAANLLVVDPAAFPGGSLERLCAEFQRAPAATIPPELAAVAPTCGCTSHPH